MARSPLCRSHSPQSPSSEHHGAQPSHRTTVPQAARGSPSPAPRHPSPQHPLSRPPQDGHSPTFRPQQHTATDPHSSTCSRTSSPAMDTLPRPLRQGHMPRHRLRHGQTPPSPSAPWAHATLALYMRNGRTPPGQDQLEWRPRTAQRALLGEDADQATGTLRKATQHAAQGGPPGTPSEESRPACRLRRAGWPADPGKAGWHAP